MPPPNPEIKRFLDQANSAMEEYARTGDAEAIMRMMVSYAKVNELLLKEFKHSETTRLQQQLARAGDNPPPGLLAKIQVATQAYQTWMTCLKSSADSKGQIQGELARFR